MFMGLTALELMFPSCPAYEPSHIRLAGPVLSSSLQEFGEKLMEATLDLFWPWTTAHRTQPNIDHQPILETRWHSGISVRSIGTLRPTADVWRDGRSCD